MQYFVDLAACKQLFVLNSYKSAIKKIRSKKIINQLFFWSDLNHDLNQTTLLEFLLIVPACCLLIVPACVLLK